VARYLNAGIGGNMEGGTTVCIGTVCTSAIAAVEVTKAGGHGKRVPA
jgi:hypothetical protein